MSYDSNPQRSPYETAGHWNSEEVDLRDEDVDVQTSTDVEGFAGFMNRSYSQEMPQGLTYTRSAPYAYTQDQLQLPEAIWYSTNDDDLNQVNHARHPSITIDDVTMDDHAHGDGYQSHMYTDAHQLDSNHLAASVHSTHGSPSSTGGAGAYEPWNHLHGSMGPIDGFEGSSIHQPSISSTLNSSRLSSQDGHSSGSNAMAAWASVTSGDPNPADMGDNFMDHRSMCISPGGLYRYTMPSRPFTFEMPYRPPMQPMVASRDSYSAGTERLSRSPYTPAWESGGANVEPMVLPAPALGADQQHPTGPSVQCEHEDCPLVFTGIHCRGTMHRHMRLKHSVKAGKRFYCDVLGCGKIFNRQDSRLKHLRKKHPELGLAGPITRKPETAS